jgi:hypothetical protein
MSALALFMITPEIAYELAKSHSKDLGPILPDIYFNVKASGEYSSCYYFDFIIVDKFGNPPNELPWIAGAPGVIVDKLSGKIETISFDELSKLK